MTNTATRIEFRCPRDKRTMFGILFADAETINKPGAHVEFSCPECRRILGKRGLQVARVLHTFRLDGSFISTEHAGSR